MANHRANIREWIQRFFISSDENTELLLITSRNVILTSGAVYAVWHFVATLTWPAVFSPSLWLCTLILFVTISLALALLPRVFWLAHVLFFLGLFAAVLVGYRLYHSPGIPLLLCLLPLMAATMLGLKGVVVIEAAIFALLAAWGSIPFLPPLDAPYPVALIVLSLAIAFLGWGVSTNLLSAIEASSYHYRLALQHLEETRQHRAEISILNKELSKSNFQLDRLNKMLSSAHARAEEAHEERDRFAMAVSHELRSPLNFIIGFSDLMVNSPETYGPLEEWPSGLFEDIQQIYHSSIHLHSLINDILDMGKIDARQMVLFREKIQLGDLIQNVREMVGPEVDKKGLWLRLEIEPDLPELYIDSTRIRQVLINLVTNALRFTEKGGITIRALHVGDGSEREEQVRVEIEDTGMGIAENEISKIFTEFRQVGNENWQRKEGSGLGLSIGRRFVELHDGAMGVESQLGRGSCFYFTLPIRKPSVAELETISTDEWISAVARVQADRQPLLLFLSPDPFWARILGEGLSGHKIMILTSLDQLRQACEEYYPRAVLIDQSLADHADVRAFLANPPYDLPALLFPLPINLNRVTNLPDGVIRYLLKPISRQSLIQALDAIGTGIRSLLIVDDDPAMLRFVTQTLRAANGPEYELLTASDGSQAIALLRARAVDLILLDLDLPGINGLDVIERLQTDTELHRAPVIIISANDLPQKLDLHQESRVELLINRPFIRQELMDLLSAMLSNTSASYQEKKQAFSDREISLDTEPPPGKEPSLDQNA